MFDWWVHRLYQNGGIVPLVAWVFWVIFSITLHELAHGWAALWQGDDTPRRMRRMTINPLVHIGPMSLLVFALIGIAWGMMPVDPSKFRWRRKGRVFVIGAGPAMNVALAVIAITAAAIWQRYGPATRDPLYGNVFEFLMTGGYLNLVLAMFNLMPVPPLDGAGILSGLSFRAYRFFESPEAQMYGMFVLIALFVTPLGEVFWRAGLYGSTVYLDFVLGLLP
jgi:Zn-dependent protease